MTFIALNIFGYCYRAAYLPIIGTLHHVTRYLYFILFYVIFWEWIDFLFGIVYLAVMSCHTPTCSHSVLICLFFYYNETVKEHVKVNHTTMTKNNLS